VDIAGEQKYSLIGSTGQQEFQDKTNTNNYFILQLGNKQTGLLIFLHKNLIFCTKTCGYSYSSASEQV